MSDCAGVSFGNHSRTPAKPGNGMELLYLPLDREHQTVALLAKGGAFPSSVSEEILSKSVPSNRSQVPSRNFAKPVHAEEAASSVARSGATSSAAAPVGTYFVPTSLAPTSLIYPMLPPPLPGQIPPLGPHLSSQMAANGMFSTRCIACGLMCQTPLELREHIMNKHLNVESALQEAVASSGLPLVVTDRKVNHATQKLQAGEVGEASGNGKNKHDFGIPNFALLSSSAATTQTSVLPTAVHRTDLGDKNFPQLPGGAHLKSLPIPSLPSSYSMMNPLLGMPYQSMIDANGFRSPASLGPVNLARLNPYLACAMHPANSLLPNQFSFLPSLPAVMLAGQKTDQHSVHADDVSTATESKLRKRSAVTRPTSPKQTDSAGGKTYPGTIEGSLGPSSSRQGDLLHRRMSAPLIGLNGDLRHPHSRLGKRHAEPPFKALAELTETDAAESDIPKRRESAVSEKPVPGRPSAKSIEQHISQLISDNEKVLLNPVLERVKPRRVFRRNSLDPASLSSYSTQLAAKGAMVGGQLRFSDEAEKFVRKSLAETPPQIDTSRISGVASLPMTSSRGMSSSEYDRMIQLTRAPSLSSAARPFHLVDTIPDYALSSRVSASDHEKQGGNVAVLGKRSLSTSAAPVGIKRPRRMTFFECSDCGVRYRKEDNYVIHKEMYCKYRRSKFSPLSRLDVSGRQPPAPDPAKDAPSRQSVIQRAVMDQSTASSSSSQASTPRGTVGIHRGYTKILPPDNLSALYAKRPRNYAHAELNRTKSADDALRAERTPNIASQRLARSPLTYAPEQHLLRPQPSVRGQGRVNEAESTCRNGPGAAKRSGGDALLSSVSSIPTSKLPPNKRHMHLLRCSDDSRDSGTHSSIESTSPKGLENVEQPVDSEQSDSARGDSGKRFVHTLSAPNRSDLQASTEANEIAVDFNELSVPRSNYKLLLHQISLRNMQDIGYMNGATTHGGPKPQTSAYRRKVSLENLDPHAADGKAVKHHRSYSTPVVPALSGLALPKPSRESDRLRSLSPARRGAPKRPFRQTLDVCRTEREALIGDDDRVVSHIKAKRNERDNEAREAASSGKGETHQKREKPQHTLEIKRTPVIVPANRSIPDEETNGKEEGGPCERGAISDGGGHISSICKHDAAANASGNVALPPAVPYGKLEKARSNNVSRGSSLLFPHMQPTMGARSHVTFCCVLNPQPTYMEVEAAKKTDKAISMYSQWAVSEPILLPTDLSIVDLLNGWKRSQEGYRRSIFVNTSGSTKLLSTDNKSYERQCKKDACGDSDKERSSPQVNSSSASEEAAKICEDSRTTVPTVRPQSLQTSSRAVFASCENQPRPALGSIVPESSSTKPPSLHRESASDHNVKKNDSGSRVRFPDVRAKSPQTRGERSPTKVTSRVTPGIDSDSRDSSSSSSSSSMQERHPGKVKRRRSRRERSAASPREQKRVSHNRSPSPSYSRLAVHHGKTCSGEADEKLRHCALCSIKAGLVPENGGSGACSPCCRNDGNPHATTRPAPMSEASAKSSHPSVLSTPSAQYLSPPSHQSTYLDRTRASTGSTQHWISTSSVERRLTPTSAEVVFRYPSPHRNSETDLLGPRNGALSPNMSSLSPCPATDRSSSDAERSPTLTKSADGVSAVVSSSLAEVVSEVMRFAAMQTKRQGKGRNRGRHLLPRSRALHPLSPGGAVVASSEYVLPWAASQTLRPASSEKPWLMVGGRSRLNATTMPIGGGEKTEKLYSGPPACDIVLTPATPSPVPDDCEPDFSAADDGKPFQAHGKFDLDVRNVAPQKVFLTVNSLASSISASNDEPAHGGSSVGGNSDVDVEEIGSSDGEEDARVSSRSDRESSPMNSAARPFKCDECKVAFRIGGHLAKHLRSKGHAVAMQKKTLNRLKQQQHQKVGNGLSAIADAAEFPGSTTFTENVSKVNGDARASSTFAPKVSSGNNQVVEGTEGLARSQVKALFEGNDEYACISTCDDVFSNDVVDDLTGTQDPRPFKCLACNVAFRFQGHLDRHFRSNAHLLAVGHYELGPGAVVSRPNSDKPLSETSASDASSSHDLPRSPRREGSQERVSRPKPVEVSRTPNPDIQARLTKSPRSNEHVANHNAQQSSDLRPARSSPFPNGLLRPSSAARAAPAWPTPTECTAGEHSSIGRQLFIPYREQPIPGDVVRLDGSGLSCTRATGQSDSGASLRVSEPLMPAVAVPL